MNQSDEDEERLENDKHSKSITLSEDTLTKLGVDREVS